MMIATKSSIVIISILLFVNQMVEARGRNGNGFRHKQIKNPRGYDDARSAEELEARRERRAGVYRGADVRAEDLQERRFPGDT